MRPKCNKTLPYPSECKGVSGASQRESCRSRQVGVGAHDRHLRQLLESLGLELSGLGTKKPLCFFDRFFCEWFPALVGGEIWVVILRKPSNFFLSSRTNGELDRRIKSSTE